MTCGAGRPDRTTVLPFRASPLGAPTGGRTGATTGAPGVPGAGGKAGAGGVSVPFGSFGSRVSFARSVAGGTTGGLAGPPAAGTELPASGGSGRSVIPPAPTTAASGGLDATVVPATGEVD